MQVIEVRRAGMTIRAKRRERAERVGRASSVACMCVPRVARCARVVIGTDDELRVGMALANCRRDMPKVAGVEGNSDGVAGGRVDAGASGITFCDADHFAGNAYLEVNAGNAPALQESLGSAHSDELQAM